jgi:integrase
MGREKRLYTVGDYWLDTRPESPFYQIRWYDPQARTARHRSTGRRDLADAKAELHKFVEAERARGKQAPEEAPAVPLLMLYWDERGRKAIGSAQIASSLRQFIAFLRQDRVTIGVTVAGLTPDVFKRFIAWRLNPHNYELTWLGREYRHSSPGVKGESVKRNLEDVRAALNHHADAGRLAFAPKVRSVEPSMRSPPRDVSLSYEQLGAMVGYALNDLGALRWLLGMIATGARPDAVLRWRPKEQMKRELFDTHPIGAPVTKKRNAVVPVIPEFRPWLDAWAEYPHPPVLSRKRWWRTMRRVLELPANAVPKTIRHSIATELRAMGVPQSDVEGLLGHLMSNRITAVYAKYDPARLSLAKQALSLIWARIWGEALAWLADHYRTTDKFGGVIVVARERQKC